MRRLALLLLSVFMMALYTPGFAAEMTKGQKDECLLASKGCLQEVDTLQQKIKKLNAEIKKGKKVYTQEEIRKLNEKLKEAEKMVDNLLQP